MQTQEQYIQEAIQFVSAWPDIPDEEFADTVNMQAMIMSGCCPESWGDQQDELNSTYYL
jgi:hypothetical protein